MHQDIPDRRIHSSAAGQAFRDAEWDAQFGIAPPRGWRKRLLDLGHVKAVAVITAISVVLSLLMTAGVSVMFDNVDYLLIDFVIATIVPLVIAPLASFYAMGLLYEVEAARVKLQVAVMRDSLTGLYNRRYFVTRLRDEIERARRHDQPLALILLDIDHFKEINDSFGHRAGDIVLQRLSQILEESLRPYDLVARYGGEEFVALLPGVDLNNAQTTATRIRHALASGSFDLTPAIDKSLKVTASLGVTCLGNTDDSADCFLARADHAMYAAKKAGRNRLVSAPPASVQTASLTEHGQAT